MATERSPLLPPNEDENGRSNGRSQSLGTCQRRQLAFKVAIIAVVIAFPLWVVFFFPLSRRATVPTIFDHDFGVGFDLTSPYGSAAISYPNGTVVEVAKIDAPLSYQSMIHRLSLDSSRHLHDPYKTIGDAFKDEPRQIWRRARKALGLPASRDAGELSDFILRLRASVEAHLGGRSISGAVVTIPHLAALYQEDLVDAFEYAGLIYLSRWPYWFGYHSQFCETGAVYAAHGFGLCSNYTDLESCKHDKENPTTQPLTENVLGISYTRRLLTSTFGLEIMGFGWSDREYFYAADANLGWDNRAMHHNEVDYWKRVRSLILRPVLLALRANREISKVFWSGDSVEDERFQEIVRDALSTAIPNLTERDIFALDPIFSAAKGAAEMAKRVWWTYNHTGEPEH